MYTRPPVILSYTTSSVRAGVEFSSVNSSKGEVDKCLSLSKWWCYKRICLSLFRYSSSHRIALHCWVLGLTTFDCLCDSPGWPREVIQGCNGSGAAPTRTSVRVVLPAQNKCPGERMITCWSAVEIAIFVLDSFTFSNICIQSTYTQYSDGFCRTF